ncbi:hypothetical protein B5K06_09950 [Rhizobium grahamii]|uniref:Uncharacterized protein n=1 Tax=Rhizobium grahamii TaxID=1120045 RepID=A0A370KSC7_9HYPH|nr:hypothetical protein B5K06_09950 [Rhizobium grahamii]
MLKISIKVLKGEEAMSQDENNENFNHDLIIANGDGTVLFIPRDVWEYVEQIWWHCRFVGQTSLNAPSRAAAEVRPERE